MNKIKSYNGDLFILDNNKWININNKVSTDKQREYYLKGMIEQQIIATGKDPDYIESKEINGQYNKLMRAAFYTDLVEPKQINRSIIQFTNGYLDLSSKDIVIEPEVEPEFTPFQIHLEINKEKNPKWNPKTIDLVDEFLDEVSDHEEAMKTGLLEIIGSAMSPRNDSIMPIFYSPHKSSGKGTIIEIMRNINQKTREIKGKNWWEDNGRFALAPARGQLTVFIDEVPPQLPSNSSEIIKSAADSKEYLEVERKGIDQEAVLNTPLFLATTNNYVELYSIDDSIKGRVIWFDFKLNSKSKRSKFTMKEIDIITKDQDALEYIAYLAIQAYKEVLNRPGTRNEKFTLPKSHFEFWDNANIANKGKEIIESNQNLSDLFEARVSFLANDDLKEAFNNYKINNPDEKISFKGFQNEVMSYIHSNKLGAAKRTRNGTLNQRGIGIEWNGRDDESN